MTQELEGKVAVITGGTRGLGLAIAHAYAEAGARVVVASRRQASVDIAVQQLTAAGAQATGLAVDVAELASVEALAAHAEQRFGRIDIWVNNAGIGSPLGPTIGTDPATFHQVLQTNIIGTYNGSFTAMRRFTAQRSGKLINVLGRGDDKPLPFQIAYGSSKNWMRVFTTALADETKDSGVGVFAFNPGLVITEMLTSVDVVAGSEAKMKQFPTIVRMWAKPAAVPAAKAVWLASAATDGKTGLRVSMLSPSVLAGGVLREGWRTLLRRPAPPLDIDMETVPYYKG